MFSGEFMWTIDEGENTEWNIEWDQRQEGTQKPYVNTKYLCVYLTKFSFPTHKRLHAILYYASLHSFNIN